MPTRSRNSCSSVAAFAQAGLVTRVETDVVLADALGHEQAEATPQAEANALAHDLRSFLESVIASVARKSMTTQEPTASDAIGSRILSGLAWKAGSQLTLQISRMVVALILARLLAPDDWGLAAMVLVFSGFVVVFTDNALGTALIQRRALLPGDRSTVFWTSAMVGLLLAVPASRSPALSRASTESPRSARSSSRSRSASS